MVLQSLDRGLDALNILAKHDLVSVTELAKELEVDKSTASRIMETLRQHDMVQLDKKTRKYKLGFRVLHLAERMEEILEDYEFTSYTVHTITEKAKLLEEFEKIRSQGYAVDDEEMFIGVRCIAVPVFGYLNSVRYGIGISGPIDLMSPENLEIYRKRLMVAAKKIRREVELL